jgi:multidrug efflux pump subunit AcrA (membrane-fusion protein)
MNEYAYADAVARHLETLRAEMTAMMRLERSDRDAAVAKAQNEERAARVRHIEDVARDLRAEFRREVMELREEMGELVAEVHQSLESEKETRALNDIAIGNALDARTGHLA